MARSGGLNGGRAWVRRESAIIALKLEDVRCEAAREPAPETHQEKTKAHADNGVDVSAFTVHVQEDTTVLFPIAGNASEVTRIMGTAIDAVLRGEADVDAIVSANDDVNAAISG